MIASPNRWKHGMWTSIIRHCWPLPSVCMGRLLCCHALDQRSLRANATRPRLRMVQLGRVWLWVPSVWDGPSLVSVRATSSHLRRSQMSMRAFNLRSWSMYPVVAPSWRVFHVPITTKRLDCRLNWARRAHLPWLIRFRFCSCLSFRRETRRRTDRVADGWWRRRVMLGSWLVEWRKSRRIKGVRGTVRDKSIHSN